MSTAPREVYTSALERDVLHGCPSVSPSHKHHHHSPTPFWIDQLFQPSAVSPYPIFLSPNFSQIDFNKLFVWNSPSRKPDSPSPRGWNSLPLLFRWGSIPAQIHLGFHTQLTIPIWRDRMTTKTIEWRQKCKKKKVVPDIHWGQTKKVSLDSQLFLPLCPGL